MTHRADQLPAPRRLALIAGAALITTLVWALGLALWASPAAANDRFNLDPNATSTGNLAEDAAGNAYVGWMDSANDGTAMFCKIPAGGTCTHPITLSNHAGYVPDQVHPVLGSGSTVYLVGPGYDGGGVVIWTSTNGGESFNSGVVSTTGYPDKSEPNSVLLSGSELLIGTSHVGVGFGATPVSGASGSGFGFPGASGPYSLQVSLGLAAPGDPVETWWEWEGSNPIKFSRYKGSGPLTSESDWTAPAEVTKGEAPRLSGGTAGLFLLSDDYASGSSEADTVDVRKYSSTTFSFGAPVALRDGPAYDPQTGGAIAQSPSGLVAVAWPQQSGATGVMQLYLSSNGGASFGAPTNIAHLGPGYENSDNAQLTVNNTGGGWLTYLDSEGLQVADLSPLVEPQSSGPAPGTPVPAKPSTPAAYSGATKTTSTAVGGELLTLKVPKACLAAEQPFYVGVGKQKRHGIAKELRSQIKVSKVTFTFDGLKKTLRKKPFRWLITPPALAAGHPYTVAARVGVTIEKNGAKKKLVKTLKGQVSIC